MLAPRLHGRAQVTLSIYTTAREDQVILQHHQFKLHNIQVLLHHCALCAAYFEYLSCLLIMVHVTMTPVLAECQLDQVCNLHLADAVTSPAAGGKYIAAVAAASLPDSCFVQSQSRSATTY